MLLSTKGIVLQSLKYGENSLISKVFSEDKGLVTLISSKSKGRKKKQGHFFQPLCAIQFVCYLSNKSNLHRVKEISFNTSLPPHKEHVAINAIRFFLAEFLTSVIKEEEQNSLLYAYLERQITILNMDEEQLGVFPIRFLIQLLDIMGIQPLLNPGEQFLDFQEGGSSQQKPHHSDFCDKSELDLLLMAYQDCTALTKKQRNSLLNVLIAYYNVQVGGGLGTLKSKAVLEVVFS